MTFILQKRDSFHIVMLATPRSIYHILTLSPHLFKSTIASVFT